MNCPTGCSTFGPHEARSIRDSDSQREREFERVPEDLGLRMEESIAKVTANKQTLKNSFCVL
jgi:hypothetical protein